MASDQPWNIIINLSTCSAREWSKWKSLLERNHIPFAAHETASLDQVSSILSSLLKEGCQKYLFAGGDGTLHHGGNLLLKLAGEKSNQFTIGVLPSGTGNDWFRTFGVAENKIIDCIKEGHSTHMNVIKITWPDGRIHYAFNMVGGALDAAVVDSLRKSNLNIPGSIKYPIALIKSLMKPHRWKGNILVDGKNFAGDWLTIQAGFGKYCGGGMYVLPHAEENRAAILLMKPKSILRLLTSLPLLYNGKIAQQKEAVALHFSTIEIKHFETPIPIEADGEWLGESPVRLEVCYGMIQRIDD